MSEIIFLAVLALIVIGPKELPELARTLGRFINELKRSTSGLTDDLKTQAGLDFNLEDSLLNSRKKPEPPPQHAQATTPVVEPEQQLELPVQAEAPTQESEEKKNT